MNNYLREAIFKTTFFTRGEGVLGGKARARQFWENIPMI
jgi:hypothetical protein